MKKLFQTFKWLSYPLACYPRGVYGAFVNSLLPLYLATFTNNTALIGLLVTVSACQSALMPLIFGPLSDKTSSRVGRRKIYILVGIIFSSSIILLFPMARSLQLLIILILLAGFGVAVTSAPHMAMVSLNSKKESRAQMVALLGVFYLLGQITLTILALTFWKSGITPSAFFIIAVLFILPTVPLLIFSHDETKPSHDYEKVTVKTWIAFFTDRTRSRYMISQFILWFGINSVLPFFTLFVSTYLGLPQQKAILFYLLIVAASGIFAFPFALLGKKWDETKVFKIGLLFLLLAGIIGIFAKQMPEIVQYAIAFFAGIGNAATTAFSYTLFTKMVPENKIGLAGGVHAFLISGLAPVAAITSGALIGAFGYPSMFVVITVTTLISIILIRNTHGN